MPSSHASGRHQCEECVVLHLHVQDATLSVLYPMFSGLLPLSFIEGLFVLLNE